jgi:hypothetical protein
VGNDAHQGTDHDERENCEGKQGDDHAHPSARSAET